MKAYVKPDVCYEDFQLSTHIARCDVQVDKGTENWDYPTSNNIPLLTEKDICTYFIYCYTNGSGEYGAFQS